MTYQTISSGETSVKVLSQSYVRKQSSLIEQEDNIDKRRSMVIELKKAIDSNIQSVKTALIKASPKERSGLLGDFKRITPRLHITPKIKQTGLVGKMLGMG